MKPTDLKCYPQVAAVIGETLTDYELGRVIDCEECDKGTAFFLGFSRDDSPQGYSFWRLIEQGQNPYDHGHEKPDVKEWVYIRDLNFDFKDEWFYKKDGKWIATDGTFYKIGCDEIEILATHKSVTMPDWVPDKKGFSVKIDPIDIMDDKPATKSEHGDTIEPSEKLKAAFDKPANKYKVLCKGVEIDVYDVLLAYGVTNPADQHAIKKMLMPGKRGVKGANQDRKEAIQSLERAIELASASE